MKEGYLFAGYVGKFDKRRIERFYFAAGKIFKETAESDKVVGLGDCGEV